MRGIHYLTLHRSNVSAVKRINEENKIPVNTIFTGIVIRFNL